MSTPHDRGPIPTVAEHIAAVVAAAPAPDQEQRDLIQARLSETAEKLREQQEPRKSA
jgi:hypothetical protein